MPRPVTVEIGERMHALRLARGLTLQDVADRSGLSKSHLWAIESGKSPKLRVDTVVKIASVFGVSFDALIGIASDQPSLHPDALRIACEVDALLRNRSD